MEKGEGEGIFLLLSTFTQCSLTFICISPEVRQKSSFKTRVSNILLRLSETSLMENIEYDKLDPSTRTKDYHHREAAASLNAATEALRACGGSQEDEPVSLTVGKGMCLLPLTVSIKTAT